MFKKILDAIGQTGTKSEIDADYTYDDFIETVKAHRRELLLLKQRMLNDKLVEIEREIAEIAAELEKLKF
ncbi:hypothetical protein [Vibrio alginolyticus]|uniref:hypothetical protein n=1 Tax=Vibrio alginolyticus TaxID=663 RepID=UPI00215C2800|nr:hypothetical protein [Vibrio alginolyticus]MCR9532709.1 hypothetical protein [Vibrio alginolyticus]